MLQDKFVNRELFAVFSWLDVCCDFADLQHERMEANRLALGNLFRRDRNKREQCCGGVQPKSYGPLAKMQFVAGCESEQDGGKFFVLPFLYLGWRVRDRLLPYIEVVEFPLLQNGISEISELEFKQSGRSGIRFSRCIRDMTQLEVESVRKSPSSNFSSAKWLEQVRRSLLADTFDGNELFPVIYFSRFEFASPLEDDKKYISASVQVEEALGMELHQERVVFHPELGMKDLARMKTFAIQRSKGLQY